MNVLRKLTNSLVIYSKFATFNNLLKNWIFFRKNPFSFLRNYPIFERFEIFYFFSRLVVQLCFFWQFWKNQETFRRNNFFVKKNYFWTFRENLLIRLHFASNWLLLAVLKKTQEIFWKNQSFFLKKKPLFQRFDRS